MPIWLIELFGGRDLQLAFMAIALMTAPIWLAMIALPRRSWVRGFCAPLIVCPIYSFVLLGFIWKAYEASLTPAPVDSVSYEEAKAFIRHPVAFLALFCNLQILNLGLGTYLFQKANRMQMKVPVELVLCWLLGAVAIVPFVARLLIRGKSLQ